MSDATVVTDTGDVNTQADSTPVEENTVETPENIEEESTQQPQEEGEAGDKKKNPPFNEHPRWKEMMQKLKTLEQENQQLKTGKSQPEVKPAQLTDKDKEIEALFEGLPETEFQNEYKTYGDFYRDIRRSVIRDLVAISEKQAEQAKASEEQKYQEFRTRFAEIKDELGDEADSFTEFVQEVAKENPESNLSLDQLYTMYLKEFRTIQSKSVNPNKVTSSKIAKNPKPSGSSGKKPSYEYIANRSLSEIASDVGF